MDQNNNFNQDENFNQNLNYNPNFNPSPNNAGKTILVLSIIVSFLVGSIGGFLVGETRCSSKQVLSSMYTNDNSGNVKNDNVSTEDEGSEINIDFSQYKIGNSNFTIDTYYSDEESKLYASKVIGQNVPDIRWKNAAGEEFSALDMKGEYIIEFFMTTCGYCNNAIPEVDAFRAAHPDMKVLSLAFDNGDISAFNAAGENAFYIENLNTDAEVVEFTNNMPFVPAVIYVKDGVVQLLTFGGPTQSSMEDAMKIAFN